MLTDEQINILVDGIYSWAKGHDVGRLPPYSAALGSGGRENQFLLGLCQLPRFGRKA
jgi:hypothetical protein